LLPTLANLATQYPGQILHTTINANSQRQATVAAQKTLEHLTASHITAVAVVILDTPTGNCLAAVSLTSDIQKSAAQIDLTTRPRSTGSTLKPFIYAAAFDAGICTPQSIINDTPTAWAGYEPSDYDRDFRGPLTAAGALAQSRNIPALLLLSKVGIPRAIQIMSAMGLKTLAKTPDQYGLPLAIGGADATPLELAEAYATLARNGQHLPAHLLKKTEMGTQLISGRASDLREMGTQLISDPQHSNEEVFSRNLVSGPSVSASRNPSSPIGKLIRADSLRPEICRQTLYCLADPDRTAAVWPAAVACGPAWKTGTSSGHRDAWCAAVTPSRTVVVWLGNADGAGSDTLVGQDVAAPLALQIIAAECASAETLERETRPAPAPPTPEPRMPSPNRTAGEISLDAANASMPLPAAQIIDIPTPGFTPPPGFNKSPPTGAPELAAYSDGLTILSPTPGQEILHDPTIPDASQRLALKARLSGSEADTTNEITLAIKIYWFIDGVSVGATNANETLLWTPTPGPHQIRATSESGRSAHVEFRVR
jgi:membrane carboxypeptidase/penicillin-binding protein PbpC